MPTRKAILDETDETYLFADGFDEAIMGTANAFGQRSVVAYDVEKIIKKLMKDGMTYDEAREYYNFNIIGAYVGESTPIFVETFFHDD